MNDEARQPPWELAMEKAIAGLKQETTHLGGEVMRLSSDVARLEARLMTISKMLEENYQH